MKTEQKSELFNKNSELGRYIAFRRENLGITRNALADKCGLSRTEIVKIEEGTRQNPSISNLKLIAEALALNYMYLLKRAGYYPEDSEHALSFFYPSLKPEYENAINQIIEMLGENPELTESDLEDIIKQVKMVILSKK